MRSTPDREGILAALHEKNRRLRPLYTAWPVATLLALALTDWGALSTRPVWAAIAVFLSGFNVWAAAFLATFRNVRWVDDIAPDRRIGGYSRDDLLAVAARVHERLGLRGPTPMAITPDKDLNASAMNLGLAALSPKLDAVYLHRPMLHVLAPGELASVIGHELGHYHRYKVDFCRATPLHLALLAAVALFAVSRFAHPGVSILVVTAGVTWVHGWFIGRLYEPHRRPIEYLCDEAGAEAAGVTAAINCELKLGLAAEAELRLQVDLVAMGTTVPVARLLALYEEAIPFGREDPDDMRRRIEAALGKERARRKGLSVRGFLDYIREGDGDDRARVQLATLIPDGPLLAWDRDALRRDGVLDEVRIAELAARLEADPEALLFQLPTEVMTGATHPPHSRRVLYLWRNRAAIEGRSGASG